MGVVRVCRGDGRYGGVLGYARDILERGGVVVFPTDTVYGICQLVSANPRGAERIFQIKRRDRSKTIPLLIPDAQSLDAYAAQVPAYARHLAEAFWPGGLTLVVRAGRAVPPAYQKPDGTVALRVPGESVALDLLSLMGETLAVTSANTSGLPAPTRGSEVEQLICEQVDLVVDAGQTARGEASTIVRCTGAVPEVLREGAACVGDVLRRHEGQSW